jgi:hypothetical protein
MRKVWITVETADLVLENELIEKHPQVMTRQFSID